MSDSTTTRILAIQRVVACASPTGWLDAFVISVAGDLVELATLAGSIEQVTTDAPVGVGEPVGYHAVAEVIALGQEWYTAR